MQMALQWPFSEWRTLSPIVNAWLLAWVSTPRLFLWGWLAALSPHAPANWSGSPAEKLPRAQLEGCFLPPLKPCFPHQHPLPVPTAREKGRPVAREMCLPSSLQLPVALSK